jgi:hypothetical protein
LTELNGEPTPDLDTLIAVASKLEDHSFVRLKLVHLETQKVKVLSLKTDLRFWPTWELRLDPATAKWTRHVITAHEPQARL